MSTDLLIIVTVEPLDALHQTTEEKSLGTTTWTQTNFESRRVRAVWMTIWNERQDQVDYSANLIVPNGLDLSCDIAIDKFVWAFRYQLTSTRRLSSAALLPSDSRDPRYQNAERLARDDIITGALREYEILWMEDRSKIAGHNYAVLLAWAERYEEAEQVLDDLAKRFPNDRDVAGLEEAYYWSPQ